MTEMIEELAQVKSEVVAFGTAQEWLDSRWVQMNVNPPVPLMTRNYGSQRSVNETINVSVDLIVDGGEALEWGGVNNRGDSYRQIVQGLVDSEDPDFGDWISRMSRLQVFRHQGPNGPIYETGDSRHRVHTVKALRLTQFPARVVDGYEPLVAGDEVVIWTDTNERRRHAEAISQRGWIDEAPPAHSKVFSPRLKVDLPYTWALEPDADRRLISAAYTRVYPKFVDTVPTVVVDEEEIREPKHRSFWQHIRAALRVEEV
ncbi:hypothetical protein BSP239C_03869 [Brevibacterium sp. 239c]|uniref:hypothetical protein n=1 Tax=Brevibacterium sp. 239c TaxID=1965356 RepID=UPI000C4AE50F|nr:hypothetical protein [Brevibacterium sp. 239c]SMY04513.1 hypothetical protein BSP239C_03869 [Brevibacterium sp. 239c]